MAKHLQSRRCICGHERQCKGMSLAFQMLHDPRGGHVEVPPACADPPAYEFLHRMNELRKAYFRHLGKDEDHRDISSIADAEADLPNESQFVALHHFHPKVIRRVAKASSSPSGRGRSAIRQQVPHTLTPKEIRRMRLELTAVSSEADRVTNVNGEPTEEFFFVPNYPMEDAHQDLRELSWAERGPNVITRDVYQNAKKEIQAQKKQKQKQEKKANKKQKDKKAANQDGPLAFNPTTSQAMEAMLASIPQEKVAKDQSLRGEKQSPKKVPRDKQAGVDSAELEDSFTALPRSSFMEASEKSFSIQELLRHSTATTRRISKKTSTLPTIGCDKELGASDITAVNVRRRPKSLGNDETLGASDATVVNNGGEMSTSNFYVSNESIQVTDGTFHMSDTTVRASGATAVLHSSDTTIQASNVPGAPKGYSSINDSRDNMWGSSLSAAQIANEFPLEELPKRQSSTPLSVCEPTKESPVITAATSPSSPLSRRRSSTRDSILGEVQSRNQVAPIAESTSTLAESTNETTDEAAAPGTTSTPTTMRMMTRQNSWPSDEVDTAFSNGDSPIEVVDDDADGTEAHNGNPEKNTDQSHRQSLPLGSRSDMLCAVMPLKRHSVDVTVLENRLRRFHGAPRRSKSGSSHRSFGSSKPQNGDPADGRRRRWSHVGLPRSKSFGSSGSKRCSSDSSVWTRRTENSAKSEGSGKSLLGVSRTIDTTRRAMTQYCSSESIKCVEEVGGSHEERGPRRLRNTRTPNDRARSGSPSSSSPRGRRAAIAVSNPGELFRPENNRRPRRSPRRTRSVDGSADISMDASFTSLLAMKQVVQAKAVDPSQMDRSLSPKPLRRANTDTNMRVPGTHKVNKSLRSIDESKVARVSPQIARSCRTKDLSSTRSLSPPPGLRRAKTETNVMGSKPSLSRQMTNQSLRSIDESGGSDNRSRRMALSQPIGELSPLGLTGKPKIKRIDSSKRAMQYFVHESGTTKSESPGRSRSPKRATSKSSRGRSVSPKRTQSTARVSGEFAEAMNASSPAVLGYRFGSSAKTMVRLSSVPDMKASSPAVQSRGNETLMSMLNDRTDSCPSLGVHGRTPLTEAKSSGDIARDDVESGVEKANIENSNIITAASNLDDSLCVDVLYKEATNSQRPLTVETEAQGKPMPSHSAIPAHFNHSYPVTKKAGTGTGRAWGTIDSDRALTDNHTSTAGLLIDGGRVCRPEGCRQALQRTLEQGASYVSLDLDQVFTGSKDPESSQQSRSNSKSQGTQLQKSSRSASLDESGCMEREKIRALFPFRNLKEKKRDSLTKSPPKTIDSSHGDSARCELDDSGCMEPEKLRVLFPFQNIKAKRRESIIKSPHASSDTLDSSGTVSQVGAHQSKLVSYSTLTSKQLPMEPSRPLAKELQLTTLPEIDEGRELSPTSIDNKLEASSERGSDLELPPLAPMKRHELPKEHQTSKDKIVLDTPVFTPPLSSDAWNNYSASVSKSSLSGEDSFAAQTTDSTLQEEFHLSFPPAQALVRRKLPSAADMCLSSPTTSNAPIGCGRELLDQKIDSGLYTRVSLRDLEITSAKPKVSRSGKGKAPGKRIEAKNSWKKQPRTGPSNAHATREEIIRDYMLSLV